MRVVLDTDVVVAAMRSPTGASAALVEASLVGRVTVLVSVATILEYEAVLLRGEHRAAGVSETDVGIVLDALAAQAEPVDLAYRWRPQLRDPGDEMVLETAINGRADAIVTFNRRDFGAAERFGIALWLPRECLERMRDGDE
jgi:putative PIN family toxin of toxin-antitoxin system